MIEKLLCKILGEIFMTNKKVRLCAACGSVEIDGISIPPHGYHIEERRIIPHPEYHPGGDYPEQGLEGSHGIGRRCAAKLYENFLSNEELEKYDDFCVR